MGRAPTAAPAEEVVEEIKKRGGHCSREFRDGCRSCSRRQDHQAAVDAFGKLDGVVNNAGILRDAIFHRMSIDAFEQVIKVHLMGSFYTSHAAARLFREQESGAFVHFTSTSGLVGKFRHSQLCRSQTRDRRSVEVDRTRHEPLQRAFELRVAVRVEPPDRYHPDRDGRRKSARRPHPADGAGKKSHRSAPIC